jgi:hypothetical protein
MTPEIRPPSIARLIDAWDAGLAQHPIDRALTLAGAYTGLDGAGLAALSIGERDALLVRIRQLVIGDLLAGLCPCAECREGNEFELDTASLPPTAPPEGGVVAISAGDRMVRARLPNSVDLAAVAALDDESAAARAILRRCLVDDAAIDDALLAAFDGAMERCEGVAGIEIAFTCSACRAPNRAPFDIAGFLWSEISERVERVIEDVDVLASAYGWGEADILAMSDRRRALYVRRARR